MLLFQNRKSWVFVFLRCHWMFVGAPCFETAQWSHFRGLSDKFLSAWDIRPLRWDQYSVSKRRILFMLWGDTIGDQNCTAAKICRAGHNTRIYLTLNTVLFSTYKNMSRLTCIVQKALDNSEVHGSVQDCWSSSWYFLHITLVTHW